MTNTGKVFAHNCIGQRRPGARHSARFHGVERSALPPDGGAAAATGRKGKWMEDVAGRY